MNEMMNVIIIYLGCGVIFWALTFEAYLLEYQPNDKIKQRPVLWFILSVLFWIPIILGEIVIFLYVLINVIKKKL